MVGNKGKDLLFILLSIVISFPAYSGSIARNLIEYDYEDIKEFARLCDIAYGPKSSYLQGIQDNHWDIEFLSAASVPCGIKACNGPLTVIAYAGTSILGNFETFLADTKIARAETGLLFPELKGKGVLHKGISQFYADLKDSRTSKLLKDFDADEKLILAGHSLGGALAVCGALEILYEQQYQRELYPDRFCSLFTLGCPAFVDGSVQNYLDQSFTETSHLRISFDQDPFSTLTRGPQGSPFCLQKVKNKTGAYVHAGKGVMMPGEGLLSHSCNEYVKFIDKRPLALQEFWPLIEEENFLNSFHSIYLGRYQIALLQKNYRNPIYSSKAKKMAGLLKCQESSYPTLNVNSRYTYWRLSLDSSLKSNHRLNFFEDFYDSYVEGKKEYHPRVFQLSKKLIQQNTLPPEELLTEVLNKLVYSSDPQQKKEFIELCEIFLVNNDYDRNLIFFPRGASGVLEYKEFKEKYLDKEAYTAFEKRTLIRLVRDSKAKFITRFSDLLCLINLEAQEYPTLSKMDEGEIERLAEERAFNHVRETYTLKELLERLEIVAGKNAQALEFITEVINKLYQNEPLPLLMKNHLRSCLGWLVNNFTNTYFREYEQIKVENTSTFIDSLKKLPQAWEAFNHLISDMKKNPPLMEEFFSEPLIESYELKDELLCFIKETNIS